MSAWGPKGGPGPKGKGPDDTVDGIYEYIRQHPIAFSYHFGIMSGQKIKEKMKRKTFTLLK